MIGLGNEKLDEEVELAAAIEAEIEGLFFVIKLPQIAGQY